MLLGQTSRQQGDASPSAQAGKTRALRQRVPDRQGRPRPKQTTELPPRLIKGPDGALGIAISPDAGTLATGDTSYSALGEARLWDLESGKELATLPGHRGPVRTVAFSPDGKMLAAAVDPEKEDKLPEIRLWDVEQRKVRHILGGHSGRLAAMAF